jgi:hypothetical protein
MARLARHLQRGERGPAWRFVVNGHASSQIAFPARFTRRKTRCNAIPLAVQVRFMKHLWIALCALTLSLPLSALAQSASAPADQVTQDTRDVEHVMAAFHTAVETHDGARLATLFIPQGSTWLNVLSDNAFAQMRAKKPDIPKVKAGNFQDFANFVSKSKAKLDPQHSNIRIHSDGTIASVYFDYTFFIDGKPQNKGSETWQLIKGEQGWRIVAITYSSNPAAL